MTALVASVVVVAATAGVLIYRASRPETRRPGEELPEITSRLSRDLPDDAPEAAFTDVTESSGLGAFRSFLGERTSQLPEDMGSGLAWADYDRDGDDDLFVVAAGGSLTQPASEWARSELFRNDGTRFTAVSHFPETKIVGMSAAWGDYDRDGWPDLVVSGYNYLQLFRNVPRAQQTGDTGERGFEPVAALPAAAELPGYWAGASWADFDLDGDLDLYVCGYVQYKEDASETRRGSNQYGTAVPYTLNPASFEPERNLLFRNDGKGQFTEVGLPYGVSNPDGRSLTALWHDFDADGRPDLYVANDISDNALFLNRGDTFEDVGLAAWVADYRGAMGLTAGDWNRDGDDDLFVTHWVAQENALYDSRLTDNLAAGRNQLTFSDLAAPLGLGQIALQSVGWGTEFGDLDADGWLDLVVANGSTIETKEDPLRLAQQPMMVLWNRRGEHFFDLAPGSELLGRPRLGRGLALSDYDRDGDLDIALIELDTGVRLLRNDLAQGNWLGLSLLQETSAGTFGRAPHATATVHVGELALRRTVGSASYLSQSSAALHVGLGQATTIDRVEVAWPGGTVEEFSNIQPGSYWELRQGETRARRIESPGQQSAVPTDDRERLLKFWDTQRAAMDAMKREGDIERAATLFEQALELNPEHQDSRYYLANSLWALGNEDRALAELDELRRRDPGSHRGHKQWGILRATTARSAADLSAARQALERALEINSEETGSLQALGELALLEGNRVEAERWLSAVCQTNSRSVGGFFLRAYIAAMEGNTEQSADFLRRAHAARGPDWKPEGGAAEGDTVRQMYTDASLLSRFWESWDGETDPTSAFRDLETFLTQRSF